MGNISPMGNQDKFYNEKTECWYKADHLGYEGLSEFVVSELLKRSYIKNPEFQFVPYQLCSFKIGNKHVTGCCSKNFIKNEELELTLFRFFKLYYGMDVTAYTLGMSTAEQIEFVVDSVEAITGFSNFGAFLTLILELDAFVLNDDRHYRNISILKQKDDRFCLTPIFDNGGVLLSDEYSYAGDSMETLVNSIKSKPFSYNFDEQLDAAEQLYGVQIQFPKNVNYLKEIENEVLSYYTAEQFERVKYVLRQSTRKYSYLAKNCYEKQEVKTTASMTAFGKRGDLRLTYEEKYRRLLFSVAVLSGGLCAMGFINDITNVFTVLGTGLYVFYRKFVIRFEIPSSINFKEKTEFLDRNPKSRFIVLVGEDADTLAIELNLWLHLSIILFCNVVLFILLYFLNFSSMWFSFAFLTIIMLTYELFCLRKAKITFLSCCLILSFAAAICVKGAALVNGLLTFVALLVIISISAEFCRYFGKELKKVLFVRIDLPNKNTDYCEIIFNNGEILKFEKRGFYPVIRDHEIWIYSVVESSPLRYNREDVSSLTVAGHDFYKEVKHWNFNQKEGYHD